MCNAVDGSVVRQAPPERRVRPRRAVIRNNFETGVGTPIGMNAIKAGLVPGQGVEIRVMVVHQPRY